MATNRFKPGLSLGDYYPSAARQVFTEAEARKEYARLRKIANRRLEALERNYPQSQMARMFKGGFPAAGRDVGQRIYSRLFDVARYMQSALGSVSGERAYRKKMIESLHEAGYTKINAKNFDDFTMFMDEVKRHMSEREFATKSEQIVELFEKYEDADADPRTVQRAFDRYMANEGKLSTFEEALETEIDMDKAVKRISKTRPSSYEKAAKGRATGRTKRQPLGSPKQRKRNRRRR